ncbi:MAG: (Fe-S)-binding protein [Arenimonas sp.]
MAKPFSPPNTASEMALLADRCVQCGLCLPHCPTYQLDRSETESPRGRIAYMKALALGQINATEAGDHHLDHCLGCRRCESACPANVEYGRLLNLARVQQYLRKPPPYRQKLMIDLLAKPKLLKIAGMLGRTAGFLPVLPEKVALSDRPTSNTGKKIAIFTGCIANSYEAATRLNLQCLLNALGFSVEPIISQTCCGTAAYHLGDTATTNRMSDANKAAFRDNITVLTLASGCHEQLSRCLQSQNKVIDALDFIFQHSANLKFKPSGKRISLHIPCSQSTVVKSDNATRKLLAMIPDLDIFELPDKGCCGAAGLHMLAEPERANRLRSPLIEKIHEADVTELLSSNIGCRLHIANGLKIPVQHPIDFLAEHLA